MPPGDSPNTPPRSPWVLLDDLTVDQAADLLERLAAWLASPGTTATAICARALSLGETDDPAAIASWADALAARLRHRAEDSQL
jgi:hypothetical protein